MKITLAQLNPLIGDFQGNLRLIEKAVQEASLLGSDLVVFSELFLTGYPPKDLLLEPDFKKAVQESLSQVAQISAHYPECGILLGAPVQDENQALLYYQGHLLFQQTKTLLPFYDVFDEPRYFISAASRDVVHFKNEILGISICEDAWSAYRLRYVADPIQEWVQKGATLLINLTASPFGLGKYTTRYSHFSQTAQQWQRPLVMVNQVGGHDDLLFDGSSMAFDQEGQLIAACTPFQSELKTIDIRSKNAPLLLPNISLMQHLTDALVMGIRDYIHKCGFSSVVIGLSGGIDSAVVATLACLALGKEHVTGLLMPSEISSLDSLTDAHYLAKNLGIQTQTLSISPLFDAALLTLGPTLPVSKTQYGLTEQNIQARLRGMLLMAYANQHGALTLSTGNKSELAVGYCTLYGDMNGALLPLGDVYKTQVYELAHFLNRNIPFIPQNTLQKPPSAELAPGQKDQDSLPDYAILDGILKLYLECGIESNAIVAQGYEDKTVRWVIKALAQNEYKRSQSAPILKVSSKAFGPGRRMPLAKAVF